MSDKALSNAELELTQKIQMHFPRGVISPDILACWNGCPKEIITARLAEFFRKESEIIQQESLADVFCETGEVTIEIPALPRPTLEELQAKFPSMRIQKIERDTSSTGPVTLKLGTVLRPSEGKISGADYERRIAPKLDVLLGFQHDEWLREHQQEFLLLMALLGKIYIDFPGLIVVGEDGDRFYPCLNRGGGRFDLDWDWFFSVFDQGGRVAVSSK